MSLKAAGCDKATLTVYAEQPDRGAAYVETRKSRFSFWQPPQNLYPIGEELLAYATAKAGYAFAGWSGDASGSENPLSVELTDSKTVIANFVPGARLTFHASEGRVEILPRKEIYDIGETVTATVFPEEGYTFAGFTSDAFQALVFTVSEVPGRYTATVTRSCTNYARFMGARRNAAWLWGAPRTTVTSLAVDRLGNAVVGTFSRGPGFQWLSASGASGGIFPLEGVVIDVAVTREGAPVMITDELNGRFKVTHLARGVFIDSAAPLSNLAITPNGTAYVRSQRPYDYLATILRGNEFGYSGVAGRGNMARFAVSSAGIAPMVFFSAGGTAGQQFFATGNLWPAAAPFLDSGTNSNVPPTVAFNSVYVTGGSGRLWAFDFGGRLQWSFAPTDTLLPPTIGADGTLYVASTDSPRFFALRADGSVKWTRSPGRPPYRQPAIGSDGTIYLVDADGLLALRPDGERLWEHPGGFRAPILSGDQIYLWTSQTVRAVPANAPGYADSAWPMAEADPQQTGHARRRIPIPAFTVGSISGGEIELTVSTEADAAVAVFESADLRGWRLVHREMAVNGGLTFRKMIAAGSGSAYYKACVE